MSITQLCTCYACKYYRVATCNVGAASFCGPRYCDEGIRTCYPPTIIKINILNSISTTFTLNIVFDNGRFVLQSLLADWHNATIHQHRIVRAYCKPGQKLDTEALSFQASYRSCKVNYIYTDYTCNHLVFTLYYNL